MQEEVQKVPVMLPHEVLQCIGQLSNIDAMCSMDGLTDPSRNHIASADLCDGPPIVPLGLWIDGTPCNWDRTQSVETFAFSFPGAVGDHGATRIPFAVMLHKHCTSHTFDDLLAVFTWSLKYLALGVHPQRRHDGAKPFAVTSCRTGSKSLERQANICL